MLLNGHGGNIVPAQQAVFEARQRYRQRDDLLLLAATYWLLGAKPHQVDPTIVQDRMGHACEWETSMILHLAPNLVGDLSRIEPVSLGMPFEPGHAGLDHAGAERSPATSATPAAPPREKGQTLFRIFSHDVVTFLERVIAWDGRSWDG